MDNLITTLAPWLLAAIGVANVWILKIVNDAKAERKSLHDLIQQDIHELQEFKIEVAKTYAPRELITQEFDKIGDRLERLTDRLDRVLTTKTRA